MPRFGTPQAKLASAVEALLYEPVLRARAGAASAAVGAVRVAGGYRRACVRSRTLGFGGSAPDSLNARITSRTTSSWLSSSYVGVSHEKSA
jgi:hypothetical protein